MLWTWRRGPWPRGSSLAPTASPPEQSPPMNLVVTILSFLVTVGVLVVIHELGHYAAARLVGVKILRFSVGFGRTLWMRRFGADRTEFAIAAIPLGGYVKMLDEREGDVAPDEVARAFNRQPVGRRMAIAAAGPAFNLVFTLAAFWLMFLIGKPDYLPVVGHVEHAAAAAGFAQGDLITAIDGQQVATWSDASQQLLQGAMERRDLAVVVKDAGGSERRRMLALSKLPADVADQDLYRQVGIGLRQF